MEFEGIFPIAGKAWYKNVIVDTEHICHYCKAEIHCGDDAVIEWEGNLLEGRKIFCSWTCVELHDA